MISAEMVGSSASYSYGSAGRVAGARFLVDLMNEFSPAALAVDEKPRVVRRSWRNIMGGAGELQISINLGLFTHKPKDLRIHRDHIRKIILKYSLFDIF